MNCPHKRTNRRSSRTEEFVNFTKQFTPIPFKTCSDQNFVDGQKHWFLQVHSETIRWFGLEYRDVFTHQRDSCIVSALLILALLQLRGNAQHHEPASGQLGRYDTALFSFISHHGGLNTDPRNQDILAFPGHEAPNIKAGHGNSSSKAPQPQKNLRDTRSSLSVFLILSDLCYTPSEATVVTVVYKDRPAACLRSTHLSDLGSMNYAERAVTVA